MIRPEARLVDRERAAKSGSASARRFVSWSRLARLLRPVATLRMIRPVACLVDRKRAAIERLGLGETVRGSEQAREIVEVRRHARVIRPVARLVDRQRAAIERLGLGIARLRLKQQAELIEQPRGRLGDPRLVRAARDRERVRRERIEDRPSSHVIRIDRERRVDPSSASRNAAARRSSVIARRAKSCTRRCTTKPLAAPSSASWPAWRANRRKGPCAPRRRRSPAASPGTATSKSASGIGSGASMASRSSRRRLSGESLATDVAQVAARPSRSRLMVAVGPGEHLVAVLVPELEIAGEADALGRDIGARLFEPEREAAELARERPGLRRVVLRAASRSPERPLEQELRRRVLVERVELERCGCAPGKFAARPVTITCPPLSRGMRFADRRDGLLVVDVVEDEEPGRVGFEPLQDAASIFASSSRASFSGRSRTEAPASAARLAFRAAASSARTNSSAE